MALHVPRAPGFASMLKDGAKYMAGLEEAVFRNIDACKEIGRTTSSSFGPTGMNKMVINHIEKLFVTNDAATVLRELEVQHPAAKLLVMATDQQEKECGDGTNLVMMLASALLEQAEDLLRMGLSPVEIREGYEIACEKALTYLSEIKTSSSIDLRNIDEVAKAIRTPIASKQYGNEDFLSKLIAEACVSIMPADKVLFNVDSVRVVKILGSGINTSSIIKGMVFKRDTETDRHVANNAKVVVYSCPLEALSTETKGTVLLKNAEELKSFSKGDEETMETHIKEIAATGVEVIVTGGKVSDLAHHYCNAHNLLVVRLPSKWDIRRLAKTVNATVLPRVTAPTPDEIGFINKVYIDEIGETNTVVFKQEKDDSKICTIVVRGSTDHLMDDIERAIDDGVNSYKALTRDSSLVPGAGAAEIHMAHKLQCFADSCTGMDQYSIQKFSVALESVPNNIARNCGHKSTEVLSQLYAAHQAGKSTFGVDIDSSHAAVVDTLEKNIQDLYHVKYWAIKFATKAACTVLLVDQIIMAKEAGGPKPRGPQAADAGDDD